MQPPGFEAVAGLLPGSGKPRGQIPIALPRGEPAAKRESSAAAARRDENDRKKLVAAAKAAVRDAERALNDSAAAEASYRAAIDVARSQQAKLFELRATNGLSRLWRAAGRNEESRAVVRAALADLPEGLDGLDAAGFWGGTGDPFIGNYGDNSLLYFHQYQNAPPGSPLANGAKTGTNIKALARNPEHLVDMFRQDVLSGNLPQVSWIAAPESYTEHPNWPPNWGAWYVSQFIDALLSNPDVWSKTVFFINFDEDGGFFDHMVPPTPPQTPSQGASSFTSTSS